MKSLLNDFVTVSARIPHDQGAPVINGPTVFGMTPGKKTFYVFPVRGEAPLTFEIAGELPDGVTFDAAAGKLEGSTGQCGTYKLLVTAVNRLGRCEKEFTLLVGENLAGQTPLLGWTSWNAINWPVSQEKVLKAARDIKRLGLAARGYAYINVDSGWQSTTRDHETRALHPNYRFPDMAGMVDELHGMGFKAGIYSTPMVIAWGSNEEELYRGSTGYPLDLPLWNFKDSNGLDKGMKMCGHFGGIGKRGFEEEDARQWAEWGFDYLKYDWPVCDIPYTLRMWNALCKTDRDFIYSLTTHCDPAWIEDYRKSGHMYRDNPDHVSSWKSVLTNLRTADRWLGIVGPGGWFDLDMLALGPVHPEAFRSTFSRDEAIFCFSAWALLTSPIQISCLFDDIDDFTLDIFSNEDMLAINQDITGLPVLIRDEAVKDENGNKTREIRIYRKPLSGGRTAYGFFNLSDSAQKLDFALEGEMPVYDVWAVRELGRSDRLEMLLPKHGARVLIVK